MKFIYWCATSVPMLLLQALVVYAAAALVGWNAGSYESQSIAAVMLSNAATVLYKIAHIPLSVAAGIITNFVMCRLTNCTASMSERDRDLLSYAVAGVVFIGLCLQR